MIRIRVVKKWSNLELKMNLSLPSQGITVIHGPSGGGKSSLLKMIAGLIQPDEGEIRIGEDCFFDSRCNFHLPTHQRNLGFVFQENRLFPHWSVKKNLIAQALHPTKDLGLVVDLLGIEPLLERMPKHLSGGEAQRVSIGRALLRRPKVLLMDEPLSSLDPNRKEGLMQYIRLLPQEFNIPILYVTHSPKEREFLADHQVEIQQGQATSFYLAGSTTPRNKLA